MDKKITKLDVVIDGKIITLKSTEDADHLHRISRYVDQQIAEINSVSKKNLIDDHVRTLLIALNIADDCFKKLDAAYALEKTNKKLQKEIAKSIEENAKLQEIIKDLQKEIEDTKGELEEFIENFDEEDDDLDSILRLEPKK